MNLYSIQNDYRALIQQIEDSEGELSSELEDSLEINQADWVEKANAYCAVISETEEEAKSIHAQEMRLASLRRSRLAIAERLRLKLLRALKERGGRAKLQLFAMAAITSKLVAVDCEAAELPAECQSVEIVVKANKLHIRRLLDAGKEVPGCRLVEHEHLRII